MKPIVQYNVDQFHSISKHRGAIVVPIDHPNCSNKGAIHTSTVIGIEGQNFETINTKYVAVHNGPEKD